MKTYVITLSQVFPATHEKAGRPTMFREKLHKAIRPHELNTWNPKRHTIRANYELWRKRFEQIERGEACLAIRQWTGRPYFSKQVEIARLTKEDGIGLQKLCIGSSDNKNFHLYVDGIETEKYAIANNDGLTLRDWESWFEGYDFSKPLAIIHFTKFRY